MTITLQLGHCYCAVHSNLLPLPKVQGQVRFVSMFLKEEDFYSHQGCLFNEIKYILIKKIQKLI